MKFPFKKYRFFCEEKEIAYSCTKVQIQYSTYFTTETETHSWVFYLGRRLADPTTRRQLTGHTLRRNRRRGLQNRTQETGSQGAFHPQTLY